MPRAAGEAGTIVLSDVPATGCGDRRKPGMIVVTSAKASGTQVFATTHSWDCLDGLSRFCREEPDLAGDVAVHKISTVLPHSVPFTGESLGRMLRSDIDPR